MNVGARRSTLLLTLSLGLAFAVAAVTRPALAESDAPVDTTVDLIPRDAPELPAPSNSFGDLTHKFIVYIADEQWLPSEADIDRMVGDPRTLNPSTAAKMRLLSPKLRMRIYEMLADHVGSLEIQPSVAGVTGEPGIAGAPVAVGLGGVDTAALAAGISSELSNYFSTDEMVDLGVFLLSKLSFFPKDDATWDKCKHEIVKNDLWIGLGVIMEQISTNSGSIGASGWLVKLKGDDYRLGWYGSGDSIGFNWQPNLHAGVNFTSPDVDVSAGVVDHVNAGPDSEKAGLELAVREHWLARFSQPRGWALTGAINAHYDLTDNRPGKSGKGLAEADLFFRHENLFDSEYAFMAGTGVSTDFEDETSGNVSAAVENDKWDLAGVLKVSAGTDPTTGRDTYAANFFVGGSIEDRSAMARSQMESLAGLVREDVEDLDARWNDLDSVEKQLERYGTGAYTADEEKTLVERLRLCLIWITNGQSNLRLHLGEYLDTRAGYYELMNKDPKSLSDEDGPLDPDVLSAARAAITRVIK